MIFSTILPFAAAAFSPACWNRRNCSRMSLWSVFNSTMASVDISFRPSLCLNRVGGFRGSGPGISVTRIPHRQSAYP